MDGKPNESSETKATVVGPLRKTMALASSSPRFSVAGDVGPIPPETGNSGFGVITRLPTPTCNCSLCTLLLNTITSNPKRKNVRFERMLFQVRIMISTLLI